MKYDYEYCKTAADYLQSKVPYRPEIGIVLGTGLGPLGESIEDPIVIPYQDIPHFLVSTAPSQAGKMIFGTVGGKRVMCMSGRFHYYEGYNFDELVLPVRLFKLMGVKALILTNAAGGVNYDFKVGDIMMITDQIKLMGASPMRGENDGFFGPRFFDTSQMFTPALQELARETARDMDFPIREGVYFFMPGPQYETPAEIRAIRILGGDAAGMSTVTETLTAAHAGLPVLAFSLITNKAAGMEKEPISGEDIDAIAAKVSQSFSLYIAEIIHRM